MRWFLRGIRVNETVTLYWLGKLQPEAHEMNDFVNVEALSSVVDWVNSIVVDKASCAVLDLTSIAINDDLGSSLAEPMRLSPTICVVDEPPLPLVVELVRRGAFDVITRNEAADRLPHVLPRAAETARRAAAGRRARAKVRKRLDSLTLREREVMSCIVSGETTKEVARRFGVSTQAIDAHRKRILRKFGVENVVKLTRALYEAGINGDAP